MARRVVVEIVGDSTKLEKAFKRSERSASKFNATITRAGRSLAAQAGLAGGAVGITAALSDSIKAASDMTEQVSKMQMVFGDSASEVDRWSRTMTDAFGVSRRQAVATASDFAALFAPLGITGRQAARFSEQLTERGSDLAAFFGGPVQDALDAIRSGLVGESEPLRRYGAQLSEAAVQQRAMADTGKTSAKQLTNQEKTIARIGLILGDTNTAAGNFAQTSGDLAQQSKKLNAQIDDLKVNLGKLALPALTNATTRTNELMDAMARRDVKDFSASWLATTTNLGESLAENLLPGVHDLRRVGHKAGEDFAAAFQAGLRPSADVGFRAKGALLPKPLTDEEKAARARKLAAEQSERARKIALRNTIFDEAIARRLSRLQDKSLRGQQEELKAIAAKIRARITDTNDATRRNNLEDDLVAVLRDQRSVQEQITDQIKAGNQALKDRADAIKSAVLDRLERRQTDVLNRRALRDANERLRIAKLLGGPRGTRSARENLQDVRFDILSARVSRAPASLTRGGQFALGGVITINVNGVTDPNKVAIQVADVLKRRDRRTSSSNRGPAAGAATSVS